MGVDIFSKTTEMDKKKYSNSVRILSNSYLCIPFSIMQCISSSSPFNYFSNVSVTIQYSFFLEQTTYGKSI